MKNRNVAVEVRDSAWPGIVEVVSYHETWTGREWAPLRNVAEYYDRGEALAAAAERERELQG
jgi:hypothetical protein